MHFDEYRAAPNDKEPDGRCDQLWRRWGREDTCKSAAEKIVVLDPGPGFAVMCGEHFRRFHQTQGGRGYTHEPYTAARARHLKATTPVGG